MAQLVAFLVWDQAVACSSHAAPTKLQGNLPRSFFVLIISHHGIPT